MEGSGEILVTAIGIHSQAGLLFSLLSSANPNEKSEKKAKVDDVEAGKDQENSKEFEA